MKAVIKILMTFSVICGFATLGSHVMSASEMDVDVGIEFTEIEPEPPTSSEPPVTKQPITKQPVIKQPLVKLPQTGETLNKASTFTGGSLLVAVGIILWKRRKEVATK